ncbi:MAG TPA: hypothetical protein EYN91_09805 [Candidatus Melainabacteria bacterium]|nr:hypothetical protein [Candidatus Melainabacteria bacterium]HIN66249.1 hypothetical protein [Candidatus Obscuribacterales bacterium]
MESELVNEFARLRETAYRDLRTHSNMKGCEHVFQYLALPSFSPGVAFDVFRKPHKELDTEFVLVKTTWRSDIDGEKFRTPVERLKHPRPLEPTMEVQLLAVPSTTLSILVNELLELKMKSAERIGLCLDGIAYELTINHSGSECSLRWNMHLADEWEGLKNWIRKADSTFNSTLPTKETNSRQEND